MGSTTREDLAGRVVVFGITGGIAAYKAPLIVRGLKADGLDVHTVLTDSAHHFVAPLSLQTVSNRPVYNSMFDTTSSADHEIDHISLADKAEIILIAPATANFISKLAHGVADDLLSCVCLATQAPILVCPSMNTNMYMNRATQDNIERLKELGMFVLEPAAGELACGWEGAGRLPEPERIISEVKKILTEEDLDGLNILITCGPTCEDIDPVRFITNRSTGKMGSALVDAACLRGAAVKVVTGPVDRQYPPWADVIRVRSAREMLSSVEAYLDGADVLIMAAAVADYVPAAYSESKIKKGGRVLSIDLKSSPDILSTVKRLKEDRYFVGFAAETDNIQDHATGKLKKKGLDMIVANRVGEAGSGFASDTNSGVIITADGVLDDFEQMEKQELAHRILDYIKERL